VGKARLLSRYGNLVVWELEWSPAWGLHFRNRFTREFLPPNRIQVRFIGGWLRSSEAWMHFRQDRDGTLIEERYALALPDCRWLRALVRAVWVRRLDRIWEEDLRVGLPRGGWPGVP
jgi:hypothetical protein